MIHRWSDNVKQSSWLTGSYYGGFSTTVETVLYRTSAEGKMALYVQQRKNKNKFEVINLNVDPFVVQSVPLAPTNVIVDGAKESYSPAVLKYYKRTSLAADQFVGEIYRNHINRKRRLVVRRLESRSMAKMWEAARSFVGKKVYEAFHIFEGNTANMIPRQCMAIRSLFEDLGRDWVQGQMATSGVNQYYVNGKKTEPTAHQWIDSMEWIIRMAQERFTDQDMIDAASMPLPESGDAWPRCHSSVHIESKIEEEVALDQRTKDIIDLIDRAFNVGDTITVNYHQINSHTHFGAAGGASSSVRFEVNGQEWLPPSPVIQMVHLVMVSGLKEMIYRDEEGKLTARNHLLYTHTFQAGRTLLENKIRRLIQMGGERFGSVEPARYSNGDYLAGAKKIALDLMMICPNYVFGTGETVYVTQESDLS